MTSHAARALLIVGGPADTARIVGKLETSPGVNAVVVGRVPMRSRRAETARRRPGRLGTDLAEVIVDNHVERVIIAPDSHDEEEILDAIRLIKALGDQGQRAAAAARGRGVVVDL